MSLRDSVETLGMIVISALVGFVIVLGADFLGGEDATAQTPYPHCVGVDRNEALHVANVIGEARNLHQFWLDKNAYGSEAWWAPEWDQRWVDDYNRTLSLLALTLRGCL